MSSSAQYTMQLFCRRAVRDIQDESATRSTDQNENSSDQRVLVERIAYRSRTYRTREYRSRAYESRAQTKPNFGLVIGLIRRMCSSQDQLLPH